METNAADPKPRHSIRWWPGALLLLIMITGTFWAHSRPDWPFQERNIVTVQFVGIGLILLFIWWLFFSRASARSRRAVAWSVATVLVVWFGLFKLKGVSGDLVPIFEFRWATARHAPLKPGSAQVVSLDRPSFPQFYGPNRDGVLDGPVLGTNWLQQPPKVLWRVPLGAAWSGFAVVRELSITQEQHGDEECVVARSLSSGEVTWRHADRTSFGNPVAGEGPRATPTIVDGRVFTLGASGLLSSLDLLTGKLLWQRDLLRDSAGKVPAWGFASSPLVREGKVIVHGGQGGSHSLFAYRTTDGSPLWSGGSRPSYSTPVFANLAGVPQILAFNDGSVSGHHVETGATLWQRPWGNGNVVCAAPLVVSSNRVLFSSGYGVGAELLELSGLTNGSVTAERVWKSIRMKSKFAHIFAHDESIFGLDDGIFACVDIQTGAQRWKEGRYGHGQGLLVGSYYLLMSEAGELILLQPTRHAPNELARFRVFDSKTWNPLALTGDLLLVRNDREAACLRLPILGPG